MENTKYNIIGLVFLCTSCLYPMQQSTTGTAFNQITAPAQTSSSSLNDQTTNNSAPNQNQTPSFEEFIEALKQKNEIILNAYRQDYYDDVFKFIKFLVKNGFYEQLNCLFGLLVENDIAFDINYIPQGEHFPLLMYACHGLIKCPKGSKKHHDYELIIKRLLDNGAHITNVIKCNHYQIVYDLIEKGAWVNLFDSYGCSKLYVACNSQRMIQLLFSLHVPPFEEGSVCAQLVDAVKRNKIDDVASVLRSGISSPAIFTNNGENLLALAAHNGNARIAEMLLLNAKLSIGFLVLHDDSTSLELILHHTNISFNKNIINNLLTIAKANHNQRIIELLNDYDNKRDENKEANAKMEIDEMGIKPQPLLCTQSEKDFIYALAQYNYKQALLCLKADPYIRLRAINLGKDILSFILQNHLFPFHEEDRTLLITYLLRHHFNDLYPLIQNMVRNNQVDFIQQLITYGLNVNAYQGFFPDQNGLMPDDERVNADISKGPLQYSLLDIAIEQIQSLKDSRTMIITLLKAGADIQKVIQEKMGFLNSIQFAALSGAIKQCKPSLYSKINDTRGKIQHRFNGKDMWSWSILFYDVLTGAQNPVDFSMLPSATELIKRQPYSTDFSIKLTKNHLSIGNFNGFNFNPNRWLNAIKLTSAMPLAIRHHKH